MKLAGLLPTRNSTDAWGSFHMMEAMTHWTCVLDDNSHTPFPHRDDADEYLTLRRGTLWNDTFNRFMLLTRAYVAGYDWALHWDDDLIPSMELFRCLRDWEQSRPLGVDLVRVPLRDCWNSIEQYRTDSHWWQKTYPLIQRVWIGDQNVTIVPFPNVRLHNLPMPSGPFPERLMDQAGMAIYHMGSISPTARRERVEKYKREDANCEYQADYTYLAKSEGLKLAPVPKEDLAFMQAWIEHRKLPV